MLLSSLRLNETETPNQKTLYFRRWSRLRLFDMSTEYRLIWFQHFHKAGGTSIVDLAKKNHERFWKNHTTGNPRDEGGAELELWKYSPKQLTSFIDSCQERGTTFVATEWGVPNIDLLCSDDRVVLITCLRDPLERFVSNFYYALYNGYTPARSLYEYEATRGRTFTMFNYYCRVLTNHQSKSSEITASGYNDARSKLDRFNVCIILEYGFSKLQESLSWKIENLRSNKESSGLRNLLKLVLRGKLPLAYLRLKHPKSKPTDEFVQYFGSKNTWDLKLYNQILETNKALHSHM